MQVESRELDLRITAFGDQFAAQARTDETARLLTSSWARATSASLNSLRRPCA
jgi:hypothetical protein